MPPASVLAASSRSLARGLQPASVVIQPFLQADRVVGWFRGCRSTYAVHKKLPRGIVERICTDAGMDACLSKPLHAEELMRLLAALAG